MQRILSTSLQDIEQLDELVDWNLQFRQIEPGRFSGALEVLWSPDLVAMRVDFNRRVHQDGEPVAGMKSFAILDADCPALDRWCGSPANALDIIDFNGSNGFEGVSSPGHGAYTISLSDRLLAEKAAEFELELDACLAESRRGVRRASERAQLNRCWQKLQRSFSSLDDLDQAAHAQALADLQEELAALVLLHSGGDSRQANESPPHPRAKLFRRAVDYINSHLNEPLSVSQLCRVTGSSIATLERTFRSCVGVTPKRYINYARLGAVHRDLRRTSNGSVTEIALRHGFTHLGQFAHDFRAYTGRRPSAVLAQAVNPALEN